MWIGLFSQPKLEPPWQRANVCHGAHTDAARQIREVTINSSMIVASGSSGSGKSLSNDACGDPRRMITLATHNYSPSARTDESSQDKFVHADGRKCIGLKIDYASSSRGKTYRVA